MRGIRRPLALLLSALLLRGPASLLATEPELPPLQEVARGAQPCVKALAAAAARAWEEHCAQLAPVLREALLLEPRIAELPGAGLDEKVATAMRSDAEPRLRPIELSRLLEKHFADYRGLSSLLEPGAAKRLGDIPDEQFGALLERTRARFPEPARLLARRRAAALKGKNGLELISRELGVPIAKVRGPDLLRVAKLLGPDRQLKPTVLETIARYDEPLARRWGAELRAKLDGARTGPGPAPAPPAAANAPAAPAAMPQAPAAPAADSPEQLEAQAAREEQEAARQDQLARANSGRLVGSGVLGVGGLVGGGLLAAAVIKGAIVLPAFLSMPVTVPALLIVGGGYFLFDSFSASGEQTKAEAAAKQARERAKNARAEAARLRANPAN